MLRVLAGDQRVDKVYQVLVLHLQRVFAPHENVVEHVVDDDLLEVVIDRGDSILQLGEVEQARVVVILALQRLEQGFFRALEVFIDELLHVLLLHDIRVVVVPRCLLLDEQIVLADQSL